MTSRVRDRLTQLPTGSCTLGRLSSVESRARRFDPLANSGFEAAKAFENFIEGERRCEVHLPLARAMSRS
jgi:hypothetical protein